MAISVQTFFNFAARHAGLLTELAKRRAPVSDDELRVLIEKHRGDSEPSVAHVVEQLMGLGIIEPDPAETAYYELTRPVLELIDALLLRQRLTSAAVITGYLDELDALGRELETALNARDGQKTVRALSDTDTLVERIRYDSRANREGIVSEAVAIKAASREQTARERFDRVNRLWERYLVPLRQLIEVDHAVDTNLGALERILISGEKQDSSDGVVSTEISRTRARLMRLRRQFADDHAEGLREIRPLYEQLRRDTLLIRGAARALEIVRHDGLHSLRIDEEMALPVWRREGQISPAALESYLQDVRGYEPRPPPSISLESARQDPPALIQREDVAGHLQLQGPVDDVLAWLIVNFPDAPVVDVLRTYGWFHRGDFGKTVPDRVGEERRYQHREATLLAWPLRLTPATKDGSS